MNVPFVKMHGAANDFVVIDHRRPFLPEPLGPWVAAVCDRRRGVGADGVLLLESDPEHDFAMRYFNADGGLADYCGNGARCLARRALDLGLGKDHPRRVRFRTSAGVQTAREAEGGAVAVHLGVMPWPGDPLEVAVLDRAFRGRLIRAGVPHFVTAAGDVAGVPLAAWAPPLRRHERFGAEGANVDFVARLGPGRLAMRTWERGVEGETLACGSGAVACALWAAAEGERTPVIVRTAGGDGLRVDFERVAGGADVTLTGPAESVFTGDWRDRAAVPGAAARASGDAASE